MISAMTRVWDWIDKRDIDKHALSIVILVGTVKQSAWAMDFAMTSPRPGLEIAAIIAAVTGPYSALQTYMAKYYLESRPTS